MPSSGSESRKIQVLGGSTYTVSIPKRWVAKLGLQPGDFVSLDLTSEGNLLMRSKSAHPPPEKKATVNPEGLLADDLQRRLIGLYLAGYNTIEVRCQPRIDSEAMDVLREIPRKVSGLELVQETESRAVLEDIIDPTRFSITMALERMYSLLRFALVRIVDGLLRRDGDQLTESFTRLQDVERLSWIVLKQQRMIVQAPSLADRLRIDASDAVSYAICAQHLKSMAETCRDLIELVSSLPKLKVSRSALLECVEIGNAVISVCDSGLFAFTKNDLHAAGECLFSLQRLEERMREVRDFVSKSETGKEGCGACLSVSSILEVMRRVARQAASVAEVAFQKATAYR
ncbi:MAG: phosphate uptake regulator PhoU [Candidatus Thermoplasmatota archaeon]|nr:phosphate uptake regulator PhoU [Candidatus Thermoplasmatota archaeon]